MHHLSFGSQNVPFLFLDKVVHWVRLRKSLHFLCEIFVRQLLSSRLLVQLDQGSIMFPRRILNFFLQILSILENLLLRLLRWPKILIKSSAFLRLRLRIINIWQLFRSRINRLLIRLVNKLLSEPVDSRQVLHRLRSGAIITLRKEKSLLLSDAYAV